jgi:hypothetical protein
MTIVANPNVSRSRSIPAVGSGKKNQGPSQSEVFVGRPKQFIGSTYVVNEFVGSTYVVSPIEEQDPAERLTALAALAMKASEDREEHPDSQDQVDEHTDLTQGLYQAQTDAIAAREIDEQ